ncbi:hypothetical protein EMIT0111MI5_200010 [Burkholderia sp. IT-111MI5]
MTSYQPCMQPDFLHRGLCHFRQYT